MVASFNVFAPETAHHAPIPMRRWEPRRHKYGTNSQPRQAACRRIDQGGSQPRYGTVTSVNPTTSTARVKLQPEGVLSGWLPILSPWVGDGWGMYCPPTPGDQVLVLAQEGDAEHGIIVGRAFSNTQTPPATPVGELWLVHTSGSFIKLQNDGTIQMQRRSACGWRCLRCAWRRCHACVAITMRTRTPTHVAARRP